MSPVAGQQRSQRTPPSAASGFLLCVEEQGLVVISGSVTPYNKGELLKETLHWNLKGTIELYLICLILKSRSLESTVALICVV